MARARSGGGRRSGGGTEACDDDGGGDDGGWTPSRPSLSSHLRGRALVFFLQMTARVCGGVRSPLIEPIMGREGKGPT